MTKDRIQINGVWYVKETINEEPIKLDVTDFIGCAYETSDYSWEATKIYKSLASDILYDGVYIKFTDKTVTPWKEDHWDNDNFCRCLLEEDIQLSNYQSHPSIKAPLSN